MRKPELLAPAGDLLRAKTAIRYGADAVYIGGRQFSLRSRASNFSIDDIEEAVVYAREHGAVIHVTVNMIPHEEDFEGLKEYLKTLEKIGVKAVICASPAVMKTARTYAPNLEVHCSTQMSITNAEAAVFLHETLGIDRVVLARECTMEEVMAIVKACPVETEAFIHGGMCVNYSGRCTLSNRMTLRDANRGGCAQSCRWQYRLFENNEQVNPKLLFTAGSKDLCAAEAIPELIEAGVSSFKIEGRMKTEYYVASVVCAYRRMIDAACDHALSEDEISIFRKEILKGENREVWGGFYHEKGELDSLIYHANSNDHVKHDFLGKVVSWNENEKTLLMETRNYFEDGQTAEVLTPHGTVPLVLTDMKNQEGERVMVSNHPMDLLTVPCMLAVSPEDIIRRKV